MKEDMFRTVATLAEDAGGEILSGDPGAQVGAISTDTRNISPGDCFIALPGENHDGHAFVADAIRKGAGRCNRIGVQRLSLDTSAAVIRVDDTLYALGELARRHRMRFDIPVIAVSGSNGKTSTKEMIAAILGRTRNVLKNRGNFNNLIGLPLTLLELSEEHSVAVVEMGINVPGEMERLAQIGSPTVAIITNVHPAHLQGLESLEGIMEEKGRLWKSLGIGRHCRCEFGRPDAFAFCRTDQGSKNHLLSQKWRCRCIRVLANRDFRRKNIFSNKRRRLRDTCIAPGYGHTPCPKCPCRNCSGPEHGGFSSRT